MSQRNYRDPLHNIISLNEAIADDRLMVELIDSAEFQRLRRIKQLGLAMFTYQGAEHSRFTHSLGVMHVMTRALDLLAAYHPISDEARVVGRAGALLHDLGHGPFSHVIERLLNFHHEDWTRRIILDDTTEVNRVLRRYDGALPEKLDAMYRHSYKPAFVSQLVSSQLDCDRMDYLLRDSLMTGAKYGIYDLEWVLHALKIDEESDRVYVESKGLYAVEEYLQARYYMFRQVYFHRTLRSAGVVLSAALKRARELMQGDRLQFRTRGSVFERIVMGEAVTTGEYLQLDDTDFAFHLKQWARDPDPVVSDLSRRFVDRKLFKAIDLDLPAEAIEEFRGRAQEVVSRAGFDPEYYLIMDRAADIPYYGYYSPVGIAPESLIYVETAWPQPAIREISEVSEVVRGMRGYRIDRVCCPAEVMGEMLRLIGEYQDAERQKAKGKRKKEKGKN
ncbi:MAG TPA: HD domain-containing protein [Blastocatellia bacterium]|nr:HD domain-containing protein [Blastocatellia bacterium]